jgi:hypothetical protein
VPKKSWEYSQEKRKVDRVLNYQSFSCVFPPLVLAFLNSFNSSFSF